MYRQQLSDILCRTSLDHKSLVLSCETLKEAHIYCKINKLSGQMAGCLIENYIINKFEHMSKVKSSNCEGDCIHKNGSTIEIKISLGGKTHNKFNFVQIRLGHNIDFYLLTAYYLDKSNLDNDGELYTFFINKHNMIDIICNYGSYAHGTVGEYGKISRENIREDCEYAIRPLYGSLLWSKLLEYRLTNSALPIEF